MTFSSRRKRPTTRRAASPSRRTAISALAGVLASAGLALGQTPPPVSWPTDPVAPAAPGNVPFHTTVYTRAAPPDEPTDTVVGPDVPAPIVRTAAQLQSRAKIYEDDTDFTIRTDL